MGLILLRNVSSGSEGGRMTTRFETSHGICLLLTLLFLQGQILKLLGQGLGMKLLSLESRALLFSRCWTTLCRRA